ncbi:MAG TPA: DNA-binding protein [Gammaproteobacteria bacterium]|nr:DNA-binding protein [Gammaproteobacteria bacterium]
MTDKRALNEKEAAEYIGFSVAFLRLNRNYDNHPPGNRLPGPRFVRIRNRRVLYYREDLDAWLDGLKQEQENA